MYGKSKIEKYIDCNEKYKFMNEMILSKCCDKKINGK